MYSLCVVETADVDKQKHLMYSALAHWLKLKDTI